MKNVTLNIIALICASAHYLAGEEILPTKLLAHYKLPEGVTLKDSKGDDNGVRFIDLNGDGYDDLVFSNRERYGVYLFNSVEKKNLQWFLGWTYVLREGKAADANSLPVLAGTEAKFENKELVAGDKRIPFSELLRMPSPAPKSPEDSLKAIHVAKGYEVKLIASEPLVQDPVFVDWDAKGRLWVVEMGDYPFAPGETTKDGKVGQGKVSDLQQGRIKILEDTNGDGVMDTATLFLDGLKHPTGLAFWKGGVFVSAIPDIFYAEDTDGDGKCDKREVWFTGFTAGNPQHLVNGFCWGLDGWYHGANGDSGGKIKATKTGKEYDLSANDFRFDPKTGEFALEAGRSQYGKWRDDYGNWFGNNNVTWAWHYWLPLDDLKRNPDLAVKSIREETNPDKRIYPVSPAVRRFNQASTAGTLTSGCSPMPARSPLFPDTMFICEPANNLVHREVIDYTGTVIKTHRHADDASSEFFASEDNWFRPTMARCGPDGALYVVDMYRLVMEHPEWIPAEIVKATAVRAGEKMGRIYRVAPRGSKYEPYKLTELGDNQLGLTVARLNWFERDTAHRMIAAKGSNEAIEFVRKVAVKGDSSEGRIQALWTLAGYGELKFERLLSSLRQPMLHEQINALRMFQLRPGKLDASTTELLVGNPLPSAILQLALIAGALPEPQRYDILEPLIKNNASDPYILTAARTSFGPNVPKALKELAEASVKKASQAPAAQQLPTITNQNPDRDKVVKSYASVATLTGDAKRGHAMVALCLACHKLKGEGNDVGPDLGTVANKPIDQLIESILDPNRAVEQRYVTQSLKLKDGSEKTGIILEENPNNVTLRTLVGVELVLTKDIASRKSTNRSLMPDGLETALKPQDIADILAWMKN
ncbi:MAG: c-type cytochrome [Verrucomicrobiaceae bacterium]|nr:c-type cytochrome [Verrucomicrobiaceae bacterium]